MLGVLNLHISGIFYVYIYSTSQFVLALFQVFSGHKQLVTTVLVSPGLSISQTLQFLRPLRRKESFTNKYYSQVQYNHKLYNISLGSDFRGIYSTYFIELQLIYNVLVSAIHQSDSDRCIYIYIYMYIYIVFHILFHYSLLQDIEYSSLYYTVGPYCLPILYIQQLVYANPKLLIQPSSHIPSHRKHNFKHGELNFVSLIQVRL